MGWKLITKKLPIIGFRLLIMVFFIPISMMSLVFSRFFGTAIRKGLKKKGLNHVQRVLNWQGVFGIFELAFNATR
jgi:hypothetical protein